MFDFLSFTINNFSSKDYQVLLDENTNILSVNRGGWFQAAWLNLRVNYYPNQQQIKISNSLHKWYSGTNNLGAVNYNDFSFCNVRDSILKLESAFNRSADEMNLLGRFEYGLNINTYGIRPFDIIDRYLSVVTTASNPFYPFYNKYGKPYSKFCSFTDYNIKAYDKGKESGLSGINLLRFEIVHHKSSKTKQVFGKSNVTLQNLTEKSIWDSCFNSLLKSYDSIRMLGFPEDGIEKYVKTLGYGLPILKKDFKQSLKRLMPDLKEAHEAVKNSEDSPHQLIKNGLLNNYQRLISN